MWFFSFWEEICKYFARMNQQDDLNESIHETAQDEVDDVGLEIEKVGLAGSPTIVAAAPKVEKATRDLQITDAEGLQSVVEGWQ